MSAIQAETYFQRVKHDRRPVVIRWSEAVLHADLRDPGSRHPCSQATVRLVLLVLRHFMQKDGTSAFPAHATLASKTGLSRGTVIRALNQAESLGWLLISHARGRRRSNVYRAAVPEEFCAAQKCHPRVQEPDGFIKEGLQKPPKVDSQLNIAQSSTPVWRQEPEPVPLSVKRAILSEAKENIRKARRAS